MGFTERFNELVSSRGMMARLSESTGISAGLISNYKNGTDPQLTNAIKIADFFKVSLDYLAGRAEPKAVSFSDTETQRLADGFHKLNRAGRLAINEQLEFQLSKNLKKEALQNDSVSEVA